MLLPLLVTVTLAHAFTVLTLRRSILTEKVSRRGFHLSREYAIDPLEILFVREVVRTGIATLALDAPASVLAETVRRDGPKHRQLLYPVVDHGRRLVGVVSRNDLDALLADRRIGDRDRPLTQAVRRNPTVAYPDEPLRAVVHRMAESGLTRFPVVERGSGRLLGMVGLFDLLTARRRALEAERRRERVLPRRRRRHVPETEPVRPTGST
jgi:CIC family chloride channel protein